MEPDEMSSLLNVFAISSSYTFQSDEGVHNISKSKCYHFRWGTDNTCGDGIVQEDISGQSGKLIVSSETAKRGWTSSKPDARASLGRHRGTAPSRSSSHEAMKISRTSHSWCMILNSTPLRLWPTPWRATVLYTPE